MEGWQEVLLEVKEIRKDVAEIKVMDAVQNEQLATHMKRSDMLEKRVEQVDSRIKNLWKNAIMWLASVAGLALTLKELLW